ncbi:hypothetical protein TARUN_9227 [Trichoderma arundinaceum]|uniref:NADH:ubiquinone oxidoreductase intermediate-associated protein 30 domain-containing protein n=1 Tax=Trichoderma arundinaceum TaxID=490622 RepID=A0A395NA93_TRIAR|nr:hypothetical protein TARUN_9227 [Trichoderma arundinaceum]
MDFGIWPSSLGFRTARVQMEITKAIDRREAPEPWDSSLWVTSDDRVRGGSSQSHLSVINPEKARFYGHLDTKTLGGAGFASQHSLGVLDWDLRGYDAGIVVAVARADGKRYALTLKDEIPPRSGDGREDAGVSWEAEFVVSQDGSDYDLKNVYLPWSAFKPTYRGRPKPDAKPLDLSNVKRVGLMMRSYFGDQEGDFSIEIHAIAARREIRDDDVRGETAGDEDEDEDDIKAAVAEAAAPRGSPKGRRSSCGIDVVTTLQLIPAPPSLEAPSRTMISIFSSHRSNPTKITPVPSQTLIASPRLTLSSAAMTLLNLFLRITNFHSPLLRAVAPCFATAFAIQGAVAIPSILAGSERFFDLSGSATFLAVGALSLYLPALRARAAAYAAGAKKLPGLPNPFEMLRGGAHASAQAGAGADVAAGLLSWRQLVLTGMTAAWAMRLGSFLFHRIITAGHDSRFDSIRHNPARFSGAFFFQAVWVSLQLMPMIMLNAVPASVLASAIPTVIATDVIGISIWLAGFAYEVLADAQKSKWQREKKLKLHDEEFLTSGLFSKSRFPNYFGEITLWTGLATATTGILARLPIQQTLGLSGGPLGILATSTLSFVSPAFAAFLLVKVSGIPLSEAKYDKRYGDRKDYQEWKKNTPRLIPRFW